VLFNMIKYYRPINEIINYLIEKNKNSKKILEIGPGSVPFPIATHFIDHVQSMPNVILLDICKDILPFEDNAFDFVYARHVLEDVYDPFTAFKELVRVSKQGYIETPSVLAEITRHIDGSSPHWRGYVHHRSIFWNIDNALVCIPKYPIIEYINTPDFSGLLSDPFNWNNYYCWDEKENAKIVGLLIDAHYESMINNALQICYKSSQEFKEKILSARQSV
jgi:hypothetical protein